MADEYGALSMFGWDWMKRVTCKVYFFPGEWQVGFAVPQAVSEPLFVFLYNLLTVVHSIR
jgi:hypothetical protein